VSLVELMIVTVGRMKIHFYSELTNSIARVSVGNFQNPQVRLQAQDDADYAWC